MKGSIIAFALSFSATCLISVEAFAASPHCSMNNCIWRSASISAKHSGRSHLDHLKTAKFAPTDVMKTVQAVPTDAIAQNDGDVFDALLADAEPASSAKAARRPNYTKIAEIPLLEF